MNLVLKTGGQILLADEGLAYECDLHILGPMIIAVITPPGQAMLDVQRHTLTVPRGASYFLRDNTRPYGIIVAPINQCIPTPELQLHIARWYEGHTIPFAQA